MQKYFKLYAHCYAVKGTERSAVYNLKYRNVKFIPNSMYEVITLLEKHPVAEVRQMFEAEDQLIFEEYLNFLKQEKLGFSTAEPQCFPPLPLDWNTPEHISNAVLEYSYDHYDLPAVINSLDSLLCKHIEIRIPEKPRTRQDLEHMLDHMKDKTFRSIFLFVNYSNILKEDYLLQLYEKYQKLNVIVVYNVPPGVKAGCLLDRKIYLLKEDLEQTRFDGVFPKDTYIISIAYFTEALQHNPYYNRKVAIDRLGNIRNCLLHKNAFGNVNTHNLQQVTETEAFRDLWYASHDKIEGIRDSELRYCMMVSDVLEKVSDDHYRISRDIR